ncbi:hypothetical protein CANCADRAFT_23655 [Tortispora caseinolytica NRRL Y-17796]|uniref:Urea transport protein n=1 Tax=Tortispora caseinolytica NRRL Y-17796 TaxID=767744 RepID=A0A1E4TIY2_9ASCO|nr:hypothetical protein CANCADRAFT_23655 [Tortispora caseinolytica NRRL Y-17796]
MGELSHQASYAIIYVSYGAFLILGLAVAYFLSKSTQFLAAIRSQPPIPLALNFIASAMGCGIFFTYGEIGALLGIQGVIVYALSSSLPLLLFSLFGSLIRKHCPDGFVLEEWVFSRFGVVTGLYLGAWTVFTLFLYLVAELSSLQQIITLMTGLDGLPPLIVEAGVTTIYTFFGGFHTSFFTDKVQGLMILLLLIICSVAMGVTVDIDTSLIESSGLTKASLAGWQLMYILPVAIATNDAFLSGFWLRTFASRNDKELLIGTGMATFVVFVFLTLIGFSGILAVWSNLLPAGDSDQAYASFFMLLLNLPSWVIGFVLVFVIALSTAVVDTFQSAMASSLSNDIFRNRLPLFYVRIIVIIIMVPAVVVALKALNILQIFLISDLVSAAVVPTILLGLSRKFYFLRGFDVMVGGFGGILTVFIFGTIYYKSADQGGRLLLVEQGLYTGDWGPFGAFVCAPVGSYIWCGVSVMARVIFGLLRSRITGAPFTALDHMPGPQAKPALTEAPAGYKLKLAPFDDPALSSETGSVESVSVNNKRWYQEIL